jgi:hypothetical protein
LYMGLRPNNPTIRMKIAGAPFLARSWREKWGF